MSNEYLGNTVPNASETVERIEATSRALSSDGKSLAEIHPAISNDVVTDTSDPNFGRIENIGTAQAMANEVNKDWDGRRNWITDQNVDRRVAHEIEGEVAAKEGDEVGRKAAQDYLITQGYEGPIRERFMDIRQDQHTRMVNPVAALRDVIKSRKAQRSVKK